LTKNFIPNQIFFSAIKHYPATFKNGEITRQSCRQQPMDK